MKELINDNVVLVGAFTILAVTVGVLTHEAGKTTARLVAKWQARKDYLEMVSSMGVVEGGKSDSSLPNISTSSTISYVTRNHSITTSLTSLELPLPLLVTTQVATKTNMLLLFKLRIARQEVTLDSLAAQVTLTNTFT